MNNKLFYNKIAKGLISLIAIIVLLSSILATSLFYQNNISGFVVREASETSTISVQITTVNDIKELSQLNEGWYQIANGFVYYLETFDSYAPLYIRVRNPEQQNGMLSVDEDGEVTFYSRFTSSSEIEIVEEKEESTQNQITGEVTGLEKVSGFATYNYDNPVQAQNAYKEKKFKDGDTLIISNRDYLVRETLAKSFTDNPQPVLFLKDLNNKIGETLFGSKAAYIDQQQQAVITNTPFTTALNLKEGTCSGDICKQVDGSYISSADYKASSQNTFYLKMPDGSYGKLTSTEIDAANKERIDKYGDPTLPIVRGDQIPTQGKVGPESLLAGKQKYIIQIKKPDGSIVTKDNIWATSETISGIALNQANLYGGSLEGTPQRPKFTVTVQGLEPFKNVEANSETDAVNIIKTQLNRGGIPTSTLSISAKPEQIEIPGAAKPPEEYKYQNYKGRHLIIGPGGYVREHKTLEEAKRAEQELNQKLILERFDKSTEEAAKKQTLTLQNQRDIGGLRLAADAQGNIWSFNKESRQYKKIDEPTYTTSELIGDVTVLRTYDTKTKTQTEIKIEKEGKSATVDEETVKRIKDAQGKGLSLSIAQEGKQITEQSLTLTQEYIQWCEENECDTEDAPRIYLQETGKNAYVVTPTETQQQILEYRDPKTKALVIRETLSAGYRLGDGTKTTERFRTVYLDKETGKEVTEASEIEKLQKENKIDKREEITHKEERIGTQIFFTNYQYRTRLDKDNKPIRVYEATKINQQTGELEEFTYGRGDKVVVLNKEGKYLSGDSSLMPEAQTARNQFKSRQFFAELERLTTEFKGLGYWPTLFFSKDSLLKWREEVDRAFARYIGVDYFTSTICQQNLDGAERGIAFAETPQGLAQVGAHIEATRTQPIVNETGRRIFIYKITFQIRNGDYAKDPRAPEEMKINVVLKGEQTAQVFSEDVTIQRGSTFGKLGRSAIVQDSTTLFNEVCIKFDRIPFRWKLDDKILCNKIQEATGEPTKLKTPEVQKEEEKRKGEPTINDF